MANDAFSAQVAAKWQEAFQRLNREAPGVSGLISFSQAWNLITEVLRPKDLRDPVEAQKRQQFSPADVRLALNVMVESRRLPPLLEIFIEGIRKSFPIITGEISLFMQEYENTHDPVTIQKLVFRVLHWYKGWSPPTELGQGVINAFTLSFQTHLFAALPPTFASAFKALCAATLTPAPLSTPSTPSTSTSTPQQAISAQSSIPNSPALWDAFSQLGFIDRYESIVASVGYECIEEHVQSTCKGRWDKPVIEELRAWMAGRVVPWMVVIYARGAASPEEARTMLQGVGSRFDFHINKTLCDLRTSEIFDIIIDFPDSMGALQDLKECLQRVDQRTSLVTSLRKANQKRLLHPGAATKLILSQYVSTIKCLRIVDPPGVLLYKVADPIRRYLRSRPDTIRAIVSNLVGPAAGGDDDDEEDEDPLVDENEPIVPLHQPDQEDLTDPNWDPEPVDAGPEFRTNKPSDIISTLVSIYDSKDLFVKELQVLLAQRLLSIKEDTNGFERVEKERRNIEILKIRFGEAALQVCEVMLKDMSDSKRIDSHIQAQHTSVVHPTIISRHFWPTLESSTITMPGQFQEMQERYAREFTVFKPDKKLKWLPHLGTVHLELHLEDRTVDADVPPLEAAFIELFSQKQTWSLDELIADVGGIDRSAALKALLTWVDLGVLKEDEENMFRLLEFEEDEGERIIRDPKNVPTAPDVPPPTTAQQQQAEQMRVYWNFIQGMLTNFGSLPIDRIQTMLKFAPGYDQRVDQLATFLEAARREGLVTSMDGVWRLNR
ncbi:hypothetical protein BDQ12DRAFT_672627 [Crucibulum laeve]|uniref:Anaphase-promoting complex subunit 2 n=1 Tax=Crucibulum laeve TaxID=68775 RepID=A0A5C3MFP9_9AGAR|nr:hypothetical protein BDQ12DRAFT_672627 [Crucibulum laeve]